MICVLTAHRPGVSYIDHTIAAIDSSASDKRKIIISDDPLVQFESWSTLLHVADHSRQATLTGDQSLRNNISAAWVAFRLAAQLGEDLIFFEDDIEISASGCRYIESLVVPPELAFLSLFSTRGHGPGTLFTRVQGFIGAVALKIPLRTNVALVSNYDVVLAQKLFGVDMAIRYIGDRERWRYGIIFPNPVQHVGAISAVGKGILDGRTSPSYEPDFDYSRTEYENCPAIPTKDTTGQ